MVLSLDLSLRNIGYSIWDDNKLVFSSLYENDTTSKSKTAEKISIANYAFEEIDLILMEYHITDIIVESPTGSQSFSSACNYMFECTFIGYLQTLSANVHIFTPLQERKCLKLEKNASKKDIINKVITECPDIVQYLPQRNGKILNKAEHQCDSVALYLTFLENK